MNTAKVILAVGAMLFIGLKPTRAQNNNIRDCLTREGQGRYSQIDSAHKAAYERRLFVTPDDIARYVFLTNAKNDGDRSAAVYRAPGKAGSLAGNYWVTVTEASDSLGMEDIRHVTVRRYEAAIPETTAKAVHELWLAMILPTRVERDVVCTSPTGIFCVTTNRRARLEAVTVWLQRGGLCEALMGVGDDLIRYPRSPRRAELAQEIEKQSYRLLKSAMAGK